MTTNDELLELFRAERAIHPPASAVDHGWSRLSLDLAANAAPMSIATGALQSGLWLVPKWILAGMALGFVGAGAVTMAETPTTAGVNERSATTIGGSSAAPSPRALVANEAILSASTIVAKAPHSPAPARSILAPILSAAGATPTATFDAEFELISRAKAELEMRRFGQARADLELHAARFSSGVFATERDALRVLVSCEQGPRDAVLAQNFAAAHPGSPLAQRLERACGGAAPQPNAASPGASADFLRLPNGEPVPGERMSEPSTGEQR